MVQTLKDIADVFRSVKLLSLNRSIVGRVTNGELGWIKRRHDEIVVRDHGIRLRRGGIQRRTTTAGFAHLPRRRSHGRRGAARLQLLAVRTLSFGCRFRLWFGSRHRWLAFRYCCFLCGASTRGRFAQFESSSAVLRRFFLYRGIVRVALFGASRASTTGSTRLGGDSVQVRIVVFGFFFGKSIAAAVSRRKQSVAFLRTRRNTTFGTGGTLGVALIGLDVSLRKNFVGPWTKGEKSASGIIENTSVVTNCSTCLLTKTWRALERVVRLERPAAAAPPPTEPPSSMAASPS